MVTNKRGWTMVELMIATAIVGLLALVVAPLIIQTTRFFLMNTARAEVQRDARTVLEIINRFLRQGNSATISIDQVAGQPSRSRITFTTYPGINMVFYQQGRTLYHTFSGNTKPLSKNLKFIAFSYPRSDDPTILSVAITMEKDIFEGRTKALELSIERVRIMN